LIHNATRLAVHHRSDRLDVLCVAVSNRVSLVIGEVGLLETFRHNFGPRGAAGACELPRRENAKLCVWIHHVSGTGKYG
jgi:hypothetical protein